MNGYRGVIEVKEPSHGYDVIGDVHGCADELENLLGVLGYRNEDGVFVHPDGRRAVFLGDLTDRGPDSLRVLEIVMKMTQSGNAYCVLGNHDDKLMRYLKGNPVRTINGLETTVKEFEKTDSAYREKVLKFLEGLPYYLLLDQGRLVVSHAGIREEMIGKESSAIRRFCLYGDITGKTLEDGFPERRDWAKDYYGDGFVVFGHTPHPKVTRYPNAVNIDTGCVFGGRLTAYRYPEKELSQVCPKTRYAFNPRFEKPAEIPPVNPKVKW